MRQETIENAPVPPRADPPDRRGKVARFGWTTADQVVAALTNAALSFLVAREVSAAEFGSFSIAIIVFLYALGILRGLVSDPLMVRFSGAAKPAQHRAIAESAGAAIWVGAGTGLASSAAGFIVGGTIGTLLVALGLLMPGLLLQSHWRLAFYAAGRPQAAFAIDMIWAVLQIAGIAAVIRGGHGSAVAYLTVWGVSALLAATAGTAQARLLPRLRAGPSWIRDHRDIGLRFTWGFLINEGAFNTAFFLVGAIAGPAALGAMRGALVLLGPLRVLFNSLQSFVLPLASTRVARGQPIKRPAILVTAVAGGVALLWTAVLLLLPTAIGEALLGDTWAGAREVMGVYGLVWAAIGVILGAEIALYAYAQAGLTLRVILVQSTSALVLGTAGAALGGAYGAVVGMLVAQTAGAVYGWWLLVRYLHGRTTQGAEEPRPRATDGVGAP